MKTITLLSISLGLVAGSIASAQGGPPAGGPGRPHDPAAAIEHLTGAYATVAAYDTNKDGTIDETEAKALIAAVADGTIQPPGKGGAPEGRTPPADRIAERIAGMYSTVAPYDTDKDGTLNETEQAALKAAIEKGDIAPPGGRGPGGPGGPGGRGHGPHGGPGGGSTEAK